MKMKLPDNVAFHKQTLLVETGVLFFKLAIFIKWLQKNQVDEIHDHEQEQDKIVVLRSPKLFASIYLSQNRYGTVFETRRPNSTGKFFAQLQLFWSNFARGYKQNYCFDNSFQLVFQLSIPSLISVLYAKGYHAFPLKKFLSHSAKKFRRGTVLCFRKFLVTKNVRDMRGGGYHDFPSNLFCLTIPNHFVEEPFCVSEKFVFRKILCLRGKYHDFVQKICFLTVPKSFTGEPFCVSQNFWCRKILWIRGGGSITIFFVSQCQKIP